MAKLGQKFNKYSKEFRLTIVEQCLKENEKVSTIALKFGINRNTIESWIRSYKFGKLNTKVGRPPGSEEDLLEFWKNKCELMEKSLASVMKKQESKQFKKDIKFLEKVQQVFLWSRCQFGYRRITKYLWILINVKASETKVKRIIKFAKLKSKYAIRAERRMKRRASIKNNPRFKSIDHVNRQFNKWTAENQCWYTDISVHVYKGKKFYQSTIIDAYTLNIIDYKLSMKEDTNLVISNLRDALKKTKNPNEVIIHSDNGLQYFSERFLEKCKSTNLIISKRNAYTCADNVIIEIFHSHLKKGTIHNNDYQSIEEYWKDVEEWNEWYIQYKNL